MRRDTGKNRDSVPSNLTESKNSTFLNLGIFFGITCWKPNLSTKCTTKNQVITISSQRLCKWRNYDRK